MINYLKIIIHNIINKNACLIQIDFLDIKQKFAFYCIIYHIKVNMLILIAVFDNKTEFQMKLSAHNKNIRKNLVFLFYLCYNWWRCYERCILWKKEM